MSDVPTPPSIPSPAAPLFAGVDPALLADESFDPFSSGDAEMADRAGRVYDDCLDVQTRINLIAAGMTSDGSATEEQAQCAGKVLDDAIVSAGGYSNLMNDEEAMTGMMFGLLSALSECGIDMFGG